MARLPGVHAERTTPLIIVGAAILADGRLLACQRSEPPEVAGRWEFPGGKVEPGEDELEALVRECQEELGAQIRVGERAGEAVPLAQGLAVVGVWRAEIEAGEPQALEHSALRWLAPDEFDSVAWLPADAPIVAEVAKVLAGTPGKT